MLRPAPMAPSWKRDASTAIWSLNWLLHNAPVTSHKDTLHKFSRQQVNRSGEIYAGNIKSSSLAKTKAAKSVLDYKCDSAGIEVV